MADSGDVGVLDEASGTEFGAISDGATEYRVGDVRAGRGRGSEHEHSALPVVAALRRARRRRQGARAAGLGALPLRQHPSAVQGLEGHDWLGHLRQGLTPFTYPLSFSLFVPFL